MAVADLSHRRSAVVRYPFISSSVTSDKSMRRRAMSSTMASTVAFTVDVRQIACDVSVSQAVFCGFLLKHADILRFPPGHDCD